MRFSDLPPGLSSLEDPFSGPDQEWEEERTCLDCQQTGVHSCERYDSTIYATCFQCGNIETIELDEYGEERLPVEKEQYHGRHRWDDSPLSDPWYNLPPDVAPFELGD